MAGQKNFKNSTDKRIDVTLYIRDREDTINSAGSKTFSLDVSESKVVTYGNEHNIYLNGFGITAMYNGQINAEQEFVVRRGSDLDDKLNKNRYIEILYSNNSFEIRTSN